MRDHFLTRLRSGDVIVADGAMGTMLQEAGLPPGTPPEGWLLERPEAVVGVHQAYIEAGADLILTCTFGATRPRLERSELADRLGEINRRAVEIAREAAGRDGFVAGDIGPTGEFLAPLGQLTYQEAVDIFAEQAEALAEAGVDVLYIETMAALEEVRAAVEGALQAGEGTPVTATLSFDSHGRTNMGVRPEEAAEALLELGVDALGGNCGATLDMTLGAVQAMHEVAPQMPLIVKPNAGKPRMVEDEVVYDATPEDMAAYARKFLDLGARIVGGCCGSTPEHIAAIARAVRS
ncbi:MAG: homocysteine S-methyltransferase family protein [Chloroflexota bacterium]|nr:homocysteine S-methyltransferase family protein [Chloroflexota bacterium]